jgi:hypothetical protein
VERNRFLHKKMQFSVCSPKKYLGQLHEIGAAELPSEAWAKRASTRKKAEVG